MIRLHRESLWYDIPGLGEIEFTPSVLAHFEEHQQKYRWRSEAGGQLFWEHAPDGHRRVAASTGTRPTDKRTRTSYKADARQEQVEIDEHYEKGLYLLGDWHTHTEPIATPSRVDYEAIQEIYRSSIDPGPGLILVVVGTRPLQESMSIAWCNEEISPAGRVRK